MIITGIVVAVLVCAVMAVVFIQPPPDNGDTKVVTGKKTTPPLTTAPQKIAGTTRATPVQMNGQTPVQQKTPSVPVDFLLHTGTPSSCGLTCRQMDASITNTGYSTAHTVCIDVSMHNSRNEIITLNGQPVLNRCIGDIGAGETKTEPISIKADCGAFASRCIGQTLTLKTRVTSAEKTVQFPDQLIAV